MNRRSAARRKRLGQHFLHDARIIDRIVAAIAPDPSTPLVEIGPGRGALTIPLLRSAGSLDVVELDAKLAESLRARCAGIGELRIHRADALKFDFRGIGGKPLKVVGNLPYRISTPLLFHLLDQQPVIGEMVFMLQKEVVDRLNANPGGREYGRLSIMIQARCSVEKLFVVNPAAFIPPPRVESAVVRLTPARRAGVEIIDEELFATVVRAAFQQRRKMLRNSLPDGDAVLSEAGLDGSLRPEQLTVDDFAKIANALSAQRLKR